MVGVLLASAKLLKKIERLCIITDQDYLVIRLSLQMMQEPGIGQSVVMKFKRFCVPL